MSLALRVSDKLETKLAKTVSKSATLVASLTTTEKLATTDSESAIPALSKITLAKVTNTA